MRPWILQRREQRPQRLQHLQWRRFTRHGVHWRALVLGACLVTLAPQASAQPNAPNSAPNFEAAAQQQANARLADTDTIFALTADGAILYAQDALKMSGYQYCSQALALVEAGEFRQRMRAASKALHLANTTRDPNLQALANRDLAIVYSYSGQLDKAAEFAREALRYPAREPRLVVGPANKVIGDVQTRRGDFAGAVVSYDLALANSSPRYAPLVRASLANVLIDAGDTARAEAILAELGKPKDPAFEAQLERTRARLLLALKQPARARDLRSVATLGAELMQREELQLRPGNSKTFNFTLTPEAKAIGVLAAYRDLEHARWRALQPLQVGQPMQLTVQFEALQIRLDAK